LHIQASVFTVFHQNVAMAFASLFEDTLPTNITTEFQSYSSWIYKQYEHLFISLCQTLPTFPFSLISPVDGWCYA